MVSKILGRVVMTHKGNDINNLQRLIVKVAANKFSREVHSETKLIFESITPNSEISRQANVLLHANEHRPYVDSRSERSKKSALEAAIKESKILITKMLNKGEE